MKIIRYEVTISVKPENSSAQSSRVSILVPEGITNTTEILRAVEDSITTDVKELVQKNPTPKPGMK
jgi:hypothetical protein